MSQAIDPAQLKANAEDLEQALLQHADKPAAQQLLIAMLDLICDAKAGRVRTPLDSVPCGRAFADGAFAGLKDPDVDEFYVAFSVQLRGGISPEDRQDIDWLNASRS